MAPRLLDAAIDRLANLFEYGHLHAVSQPELLMTEAASEIERLRREVTGIGREELQSRCGELLQRARLAEVALALVSGALCDAGVTVGDPSTYADAVRELTRQRDALRSWLTEMVAWTPGDLKHRHVYPPLSDSAAREARALLGLEAT